MEKITHALLSSNDANAEGQQAKMKEVTEPSRLVIENILNYSKALKVKKCRSTKGFVEFVIN